MEHSITFTLVQLFQFAAVLLTGLVAGLFYGYEWSVIKGLENLGDDAYLQSFQSINKAIQNPWFFTGFMGSLLVLPLATWLSYKTHSPVTFYFLLSATLIYATGAFGVTIFGNVPLNEQLAKFPIARSTAIEIAAMRKAFEKPWTIYHSIRTVACIISFSLTILSIIKTDVTNGAMCKW